QTLGFFLLMPLVIPAEALSTYTGAGLAHGLLGGALTNLGSLFLFAALKSGGKASVVTPFCALYPVVVVLLSPFVLGEAITALQGAGVLCALVAIVLLSTEPGSAPPPPALGETETNRCEMGMTVEKPASRN